MSIEVDHNCNERGCRQSADDCYCQGHLEEKMQEAYNDGYQEAKKEFEPK